jgi:hypothetical protein
VTFGRGDGRRQAFRFVGEMRRILGMDHYRTFLPSPALIGRAASEIVLADDHEIEILSID